MLDTKTIITILGALLYIIGAATVNLYTTSPIHTDFYFHPAIELMVISLGMFFLASFFWGRLAFAPMLIAGLWFGGLFSTHPAFVALAILPLLVAMKAGSSLGENALLDMQGKGNLFSQNKEYMYALLEIAILSIAIGYFATGITMGQINEFLDSIVNTLLPKV